MSYKTRDGKTHQSTVLISDSGLPIDGIATISGSYVFLEDSTNPLVYTSGSSTVTLPVGNDLTPVTTAKARYTGRYILITKDNSIYYINRQSIDVGARTFVISRSDVSQITPASIDLSPGWQVAEADIVNRLATTSSAKIDSVEFRDMHFNLELDGDAVSIVDDDGDKLDINPDGSINVVISGQSAGVPTMLNTPMAVAGDEYSISLPSTAKRFMLKSRDPAILKFSYQPFSSVYTTIKPGAVYSESNLVTPIALTIYIRSNKPNTVIETVYWE